MLRRMLTTYPATNRQACLFKAELTALALALGALIIFSPGCSSAPSQQAASPAVDVTGNWVGTWAKGTESGMVTLQFQQTGSRVVGDLRMAPAYAYELGAVEGTVVGNELSFRRVGVPYGADVTVNGDEMSGWSTTGGRYRLQRQK